MHAITNLIHFSIAQRLLYCQAVPYDRNLSEERIKAKIIIEISRLKWPCASIKFNEELKKYIAYETDSIVLCILKIS